MSASKGLRSSCDAVMPLSLARRPTPSAISNSIACPATAAHTKCLCVTPFMAALNARRRLRLPAYTSAPLCSERRECTAFLCCPHWMRPFRHGRTALSGAPLGGRAGVFVNHRVARSFATLLTTYHFEVMQMNSQIRSESEIAAAPRKSKLLDASRWSSQIFSGDWTKAGSTLVVREPATGEILGEVGESQPADMEALVNRVSVAQVKWAAESTEARAALFRRAAQILEDEREFLLDAIIRETGGVRG